MKNYNYKGDKCSKCQKDITVNNLSGLCRSCGKLGHKINVGRKLSDETKKKLSITRMGSKNVMWKGDNVQYKALHGYVSKNTLPKTKLCMDCKKVPPYDLANKGIYNREKKNWEWLCRRCHMIKDGRMKNLKQYETKKSV